METSKWFYYDLSANTTRQTVAKGTNGWVGALQREETSTSGAPGYAASNSATTTVHYYDAKGNPSIDLATIDGKWFYTHRDYYPTTNLLKHVRHYWRPAGHEAPNDTPYVWQDFGYTYSYDNKGYLLTLEDSNSPARAWWQVDSTNGYDHLDRPVLVKKGSGHWMQRTYRAEDGVLTALKTGPSAGATTIQNLSFNYDGLGNLTSRVGSGGTENLGYDILNRLVTTKQGAITYFDNGNIRKKPDASGTQPGADFGYDSTHPHAVATAWGYSMGYDANGNLLSRTKSGESWSFRYAGFDKPRWMAKTVGSTTAGSEFLYNANRSRTVQLEFDAMSGGVPSHYVRKRIYALGSTLEINYDNQAASGSPTWALKKVRIYVPGPEGVIGAREFDPAAASGSQEKALVYHYDHLGSIESITPFGSTAAGVYASDGSGKSGRYSEDAWGQRRDPLDWSGVPPASTDDGGADSLTPRGFTGHEMLDDLGLVHMNGRIYDPLVARFLSADLLVQAPFDLQSYNRYSYVMNRPLTSTDPSGFVSPEEMKRSRRFEDQLGHASKLADVAPAPGLDVGIPMSVFKSARSGGLTGWDSSRGVISAGEENSSSAVAADVATSAASQANGSAPNNAGRAFGDGWLPQVKAEIAAIERYRASGAEYQLQFPFKFSTVGRGLSFGATKYLSISAQLVEMKTLDPKVGYRTMPGGQGVTLFYEGRRTVTDFKGAFGPVEGTVLRWTDVSYVSVGSRPAGWADTFGSSTRDWFPSDGYSAKLELPVKGLGKTGSQGSYFDLGSSGEFKLLEIVTPIGGFRIDLR